MFLQLPQVKAYTWLGVYMVIGSGAVFCLYLMYKELFGTQQPQNISSRVFELLRIHDNIVGVTGRDKAFFSVSFLANNPHHRNMKSALQNEEQI